ncbi:hypothetical protein [Actinoplanes rectilineatus]|uniref:hypothetical protein n=1 Tax=Actinoplanes rectilineatus TaxID=113571 RepID=UPI0005F2E55B|nr:hypothetical protein [Actinoplanes rectilineatus]
MTHRRRHSLVLEPPAPLAASGPCRAKRLAELTLPPDPRRAYAPECPSLASRRVQVGLDIVANVCLWHSLRATQQLDAYLVRVST